MYSRYIYLKFLSCPSIMSSSRGVSLDASLSPILSRLVSSSVLWIFQSNSELLFCGMYFPWESCLQRGMGASLWTWFQVCLSTGMASEVIFIWIRLHVSAPVCCSPLKIWVSSSFLRTWYLPFLLLRLARFQGQKNGRPYLQRRSCSQRMDGGEGRAVFCTFCVGILCLYQVCLLWKCCYGSV